MTKTQKIVLGSIGAFGLVVITAGTALVSAQSAANTNASEFIDRVAQIAGIDSQKLKDSVKQASKERIDQDVKDGKITQSEADNLKQKIDEGKTFGLGFGRKGMHGEMGFGGFMKPNLDDLSNYLGLTTSDLMTQMRDGKSLLDIAKDKGKSEAELKTYLSQKFDENLKQAVTDGKLTQEKSDIVAKDKDKIISGIISGKGHFGPHGERHMMEKDDDSK